MPRFARTELARLFAGLLRGRSIRSTLQDDLAQIAED
jgi:hypothetical protein